MSRKDPMSVYAEPKTRADIVRMAMWVLNRIPASKAQKGKRMTGHAYPAVPEVAEALSCRR